MDASMPTPENESEEPIMVGDELPVKLDTLMVGGQRPDVGDMVDVKVSGTVSRIVDDCCYVRVESANDEEIHKPEGDYAEAESLAGQSREADLMGVPVGGAAPPPY
jgi:hypothetical protein